MGLIFRSATPPKSTMPSPASLRWKLRASFSAPLAGAAVLLLVFFAAFTDYHVDKATDAHIAQYYMWYVHVAIMVFIGFGFLMTFLRQYSYSAVALNWVLSVLAMLEFLLVGGAVQQHWHVHGSEAGVPPSHKVQINLPLLIDAAFCAASVMISFGAVLGKLTPGQMVWLTLLEVPLYAVNQKLVLEVLKALDMGGSMSIHVFGAYFGLAAALVACRGRGAGGGHPKNRSSYTTDITAMVGTIFLFIYWPSFNGALASNPEVVAGGSAVATQFFCVVNTVVSLLAAVVAVFAVSAVLEGKLDMVHIQNATLAGGVAVGSCANLQILPAGAVGLGLLAGTLSTCGFYYLTPWLEAKIGLTDTCGVHNLHGLPGILGGLAAAVASVAQAGRNQTVLAAAHGSSTWGYQLAALAVTLALGLAGGALTGLIISKVDAVRQDLPVSAMYEDAVFWARVGEDDEPLVRRDESSHKTADVMLPP